VPSLVLLFGLVLRGRFDPGAAASGGEEGAASGAPRLRLAVPAVLGTAGAVLTVASDGGVTLALGVLAMLGFIVTGFLALAGEGDVRPSSSVE